MLLKTVVSSLAAALVVTAQDKPGLSFDYWKMAKGMRDSMPPAPGYSRDYWGAGWIPQHCLDVARSHGLNPFDFSVFNVHYGDCGDAWVMCRHKDAPAEESNMIEMMSRLPVGMRQFVRHLSAVPNTNGFAGGLTSSDGDTEFTSGIDMGLMTHEVSHSIDWNAKGTPGAPFSSTNDWQYWYYQDQDTITNYGRTNWLEDFAESGMVGTADKYLAGGFGSVTYGWSLVKHQYQNYENNFFDLMAPGKTCWRRFANSAAVRMDGSRKRGMGPKPDVSIKSNVTIIEPAKEVKTIECAAPPLPSA